MKKFDQRQMNVLGAPDDFRAFCTRRFAALGYSLDSSGDIVDASGNTYVASADAASGGLTVDSLGNIVQGSNAAPVWAAAGAAVSNIVSQPAISAVQIPAAAATSPPASSSSSNTSWLSGLGAIGTAVASVAKAFTPATATAARPGINPLTGLPYPTAATSSNSLMLLILAGVVIWLVAKK